MRVGLAGSTSSPWREPVTLLGDSLDGALAMQSALLRPEAVSSVVLVSSAGFGREVSLALRAIGIPLLGRQPLRPSWLISCGVERLLYRDRALATPERVSMTYEIVMSS